MSFKNVTWSDNELITSAKLNQMADNDEYLLSKLPVFNIESHLGNHTGQLKIDAGIHDVFSGQVDRTAGGRILVARIPFSSTFRYPPVVAATYVSNHIHFREVAIMVNGLNGSRHPSRNGFTAHLTHNKGNDAFPQAANNFFVHYIAIGIR